jgi:hypothetical protein
MIVEDYLIGELISSIKHEYVGGGRRPVKTGPTGL